MTTLTENQTVKLHWFRNLQVHMDGIRAIVPEEFADQTHAFGYKAVQIIKLAVEIQRKVLGQPWIAKFVKEKLKEPEDEHETRYFDLDDEAKLEFWAPFWDSDNVVKLWTFCADVVDIEKAFEHEYWGDMMATTWELLCRSIADNVVKKRENGGKADWKQVYRDARALPDAFFADRPALETIPRK